MNLERLKLKEFLMGVTKVEVKDYTITRYSFWKFWEVDELEFNLPSRYEEAYVEVERKLINGSEISMQLADWVKDDLREQLKSRIITYPHLVTKAKKLSVRFHTRVYNQYYVERMPFYMKGDIYFDCDEAIRRDKLLSKLGI
jgi:hypothetical protein